MMYDVMNKKRPVLRFEPVFKWTRKPGPGPALILLGTGFNPLIDMHISKMPV